MSQHTVCRSASIINLLKTGAMNAYVCVCVPEIHFLSPKLNSFDQRDPSWRVG